MKKVRKENHVRQSNYNVLRKPVLSLNEHRLYYAALATVTEQDTIETEFKVNVLDFGEIFGLDKEGLYKEIKKTTDSIRHKQLEKLEYDAKGREIGFEAENLFYRAKYKKGDAEASIWLGPSSLEFAKRKKGDKNYSVIVLNNITGLTSGNAIRFYELMNTWEGLPKRKLSLTEFKNLMGLPHRYNNNNTGFLQAVIVPCVTEINGKTNLTVKYTLSGAGKKREIDFRITVKKDTAPTVKSDGNGKPDNVKRLLWANLGIRRKDKTYLTLLALVKTESPAALYGIEPGSAKLKEDYLCHYLDSADQLIEQLGDTADASDFLDLMLKNDYDHITPYNMVGMTGFSEASKERAAQKAFYQHSAIVAGMKKKKIKKERAHI